MRPLTLTMQAFGSYGKKTTIDFSKTTQNLFLVTGATGAGKTTIFDAIVFALYGEASSGNNKKDGDELQSQFVDFSMEPFVELVFSEGYGDSRQIYSVFRVPRHIRTKKKGSGTKTENEKVTLTMPDGMDYPEKIAQTNQKIEEIVGLTKDQFMQVGMIAQGEFMDILRASTKDKKTIFRKLFNTELYDDMVIELLKRVNEKKSSLSQIRVACQTEVAHVDIPEEYDHCEKLSELKDTILGSEKLNVVNMEHLLNSLDELCLWLKGKKSQAEKEYQRAEIAKDESHILLEKGTHLQASYLQMDRADEVLKQCETQATDIHEKKKLMELIDAAYDIKISSDALKDAEKLVSNTEHDIQSQNALLPRLKEDFAKKTEKEKAAKTKQESAFATYSQVKERVNNAIKNLEDMKDVSNLMKKQAAAMSEAEKIQRDAKKKLDEIEKKEVEWRKKATDLKDAGTLLEKWKAEKKALSDINDAISEAKNQANTVFKQKNKCAKYSARYQQAAQVYAEAHNTYVTQNRAFFDAQAGIIAKEQLVEGEPCPVCGSIHHPAPHKLSQAHKNLSWDVIEELQKKANQLQKDSEGARVDFESQGKVFLEKKNRLKEMVDRIYQGMKERSFLVEDLIYNENDVNSFITMIKLSDGKLNERLKLFEEEGIKREKDVKDLEEVNQYLLEVDETKRLCKEKAEKASKDYDSSKLEYASLDAKLNTLMKAKTYDTKEAAQKDRREAEKYLNDCRKVYESAESAARSAKTAMDQSETIIRQCEDKLPGYKKSEKERFLNYKNKMIEKNLSESEWMEITKHHSKNENSTLQKSIDEYKKVKATAEGEKKAASEAIKGQSRPDMDALKSQMETAEQKYKDSKRCYDNLFRLEETNCKTYESLKPKMKERGKVIEDFERLNLMYSRLSGKISGSRMDIETYVQRYYLDRILHAANRRFSDMSGGQFELRMYDIEKAGEGKNHGLDLMVYSTVTDKEREIRTLSGGESFMAALSLALGMADQIQENSSSIKLDVMFIDEGFGSLDDLSRNQAVKVLKNMADGSKLIGIISHVTELKQEIEDQLVITKDDNGSHHRWENS